jgi:cyclic 2,3-diphosphoglycerate synthase
VETVREVKPELRVVPAVFRPRPVGGEVRDLRVAYISTAPRIVLDKLGGYLEQQYGCKVVTSSGSLSDRKRLYLDLEEMRSPKIDAYLTEIKAAAVDVVTRRGAEEGKPVFYCDNDPVPVAGHGGLLDEALLGLAKDVVEGFMDRAGGLVGSNDV